MRNERRRFTPDEVQRMVAAGILAEDEPIELLGGELIVVSPQGPQHRALTVVVRNVLARTFGPGFHLQDRSPVDVGGGLPEPDVAVVRGDERAFLDRHPSGADLALVVEISVSSHALDATKAADYAGGNVVEYWQIEVPERRLIVRTDPVAGEYRSLRIYTTPTRCRSRAARCRCASCFPDPASRVPAPQRRPDPTGPRSASPQSARVMPAGA